MEAGFKVDITWSAKDAQPLKERKRRYPVSGAKAKRLCALCDQKFPAETLGTKVTKKRILEWRKIHGLDVKNASPFTLYDYVPVCVFCTQFFATTAAEDAAAALAAQEACALRPMIFALEDRVMACPEDYFGRLYQ